MNSLPPGLATGDALLDSQHLRILDEVEQIERGTPNLEGVATALSDHFSAHFGTEEGLARLLGVDVEAHAEEHLAFFDRFVQAKARLLARQDEEARKAFVSLVREWVRVHVLASDVELVARLVAVREGQDRRH